MTCLPDNSRSVGNGPGTAESSGQPADSQHEPTVTLDATAGRVVADAVERIGKYEVREILGHGGQATTFKAWDPDTQRTVVVKAYHGLAISAVADSVLEEGQKLTKIRSPYVVQCLHVERLEGLRCLILEYVPGGTLAELRARGPIPLRESLRLMGQVADGLAAVHARGLLHRDIKPANILIGQDGVPRLCDFGLAKSLGDPTIGESTGTYSYMAPEQARGDGDHVDPRTDLFGLGATLYFLLTGHAPYEGTRQEIQQAARLGEVVPPRQRTPSVPRDVDRLCMRCLAKSPEGRFQSAAELSRAIRSRGWRRTLIFASAAVLAAAAAAIAYWPSSKSGDFEAPVVQVAPLAVDEVVYQQFRRVEGGRIKPGGFLLRDPFRIRLGDGVRFRAKLTRPAYCFWLAFRTDGKLELCLPHKEDRLSPPPLTDELTYPEPGRNVFYSLTDGIGLQAFVLVASETPLPAFDNWLKTLGPSPWRAIPEPGLDIHRHDGVNEVAHQGISRDAISFDALDKRRGEGEPFEGVASPLAELVQWIRGASDPRMVVDAWAFPVLPRDDAITNASQPD
ncbi:MAG: protein kinase [Planctomyces sp.]|nr:protein kinase [Planctomyces sp.]